MGGRLLMLGVCAIATLPIVHAQGPARPRAEAPHTIALPVRRVVLYKNGVGYFEHVGRVQGTQSLAIDFNTAQLNDVLQSLTAIDLGAGRIGNIAFNSEAPIAQRLGALPFALPERPALADLLESMRGARLEVRNGERTTIGRLLSVERHTQSRDDRPRAELSLLTDAAEIRTETLTPTTRVRIIDRELAGSVGSYLGIVASSRSQAQRRMTIAALGDGARDILVSYISEVPVWKTTYRIVMTSSEEAQLQGWAIVDNTIGEDWNGVELSLVAGAPQSFVQPLSQPVYARRPVVQIADATLLLPQTHQQTLVSSTAGVNGRVVDATGAVLPGVTVSTIDESGQRRSTVTDAAGRYASTMLPRGRYRIEFALAGFQQTTMTDVVLDGGMMAVPDVQLAVGSVTETVTVTGESPRVLTTQSVRTSALRSRPALPAAPERAGIEQRLSESESAAQGQPIGDLFEYRVSAPITITKNQSALVPIVKADVRLDRVSLWNPRTGVRPLRSLWLTNTSALTLDGGSFTVLDRAAFAGEGLIEPMKPGERRLLSYAVDLAMQVESRNGDDVRRVSRVRIARGNLVQQRELRARKVYTIHNADAEPRIAVIEHPIRAGWTLVGDARPVETALNVYRFALSVPPSGQSTLVVDERQQTESTVAVSTLNDDQVAVILRDAHDSGELERALEPIRAQQAEIARLSSEVNGRESEAQRIISDQDRLRENMRVLKDGQGERTLLKRYLAQLNQQEDRLAEMTREQTAAEQRLADAQDALQRLIDALTLDVEVADGRKIPG